MNAARRDLRLICRRDLIQTLECLPIPAFAFEIKTLGFVAVNRRFEELLGYSQDELRAMTAEAIRPQRDLETFRATFASPVSRGFLRARYIRKDGTWVKVKIHYHHMDCLNDDGKRVAARIVAVEFWDEMPARRGNV